MSNPRYGSGRKQFVGQGIEADLSKLDPAAYTGAVAYSDGELYYSDGSEWVVPQDEVDIARPRNLVPTNETEQTQLRLSAFRSPTGETQTSIIFQINTDGLPEFGEGANLITRTVTSEVASLYQVVYPDDGFQPGDTIWWRARYLGTNSTQSQYSIATAQLFPDVITQPTPITATNAITGTVTVTPYNSPAIFNLLYTKTQAEFYSAGSVPGVSTPVATAEHTNGAVTNVPNTLVAGTPYLWRVRYEGRAGIGSPFIYSDWSEARTLVAGGNSMILEYDVTKATGRTIYLPLAGTVNVSVNWGDGVIQAFTTPGVKSHTYASGFGPAVLVTISGTMTAYGLNTTIDQSGLTRVENWGFGLGLTDLAFAFRSTTVNLVYVNPNLPETVTSLSYAFLVSTSQVNLSTLNTSRITNMSNMFDASTYNQPIGAWNTSNVTRMSGMFQQTATFNQPIGTWDVSKVTDMSYMFFSNTAFDQDISAWNTSSVTNMSYMFYVATAFNKPLNTWNTSNVTNMSNMFLSATKFNQPLGAWNTAKVTNMAAMFQAATVFNQPIGTWNTGAVTTMQTMFQGTPVFNQNISTWNTSNVTNMSAMFQNALAFNQPIGTWDVSKVTNMSSMFQGATVFNQNLGAWNTGALVFAGLMFGLAPAFNNGGSTTINNWNTSNVTDMGSMFQGPTTFNQPIGNWNVSKVVSFGNMFVNNASFNQNISTWNPAAVLGVSGMFQNATAYNQPLGNWNLSACSNMSSMFLNASAFNQSLAGVQLRRAGTTMTNLGIGSVNIENYSRTLIGWANYVATTDGPYTVPVTLTATRQYNALDYITGARFTNAAAARAFLVGARAVSVTGSSDTAANTSYTYNATTLTYDASNGWYFAIVGGVRWELFNPSNVSQAIGTSTEVGSGPNIATAWTGVLSAATVLRTGAAWTITGDSLV